MECCRLIFRHSDGRDKKQHGLFDFGTVWSGMKYKADRDEMQHGSFPKCRPGWNATRFNFFRYSVNRDGMRLSSFYLITVRTGMGCNMV